MLTPLAPSSRTSGARKNARIVEGSPTTDLWGRPRWAVECCQPRIDRNWLWPELQTLWLTSPYVHRPLRDTLLALCARRDIDERACRYSNASSRQQRRLAASQGLGRAIRFSRPGDQRGVSIDRRRKR